MVMRDPPTTQMDRRTDGQTCDSKTALCTVVHRAVTIKTMSTESTAMYRNRKIKIIKNIKKYYKTVIDRWSRSHRPRLDPNPYPNHNTEVHRQCHRFSAFRYATSY